MSTINTGNELNNEQTYECMNETSNSNIEVNEIRVWNEKYIKINQTNYSLEINSGKVLSSLKAKHNFQTYPDFINSFKETRVFKDLITLRDSYRKIRILLNWAIILFCLTLNLYFIFKLLNYKNHIKPTGFAFKKIDFSFIKPNTFILNFKGVPLAHENQTFDISNITLSINPLNTENCWYKFTSDSTTTICTNTKETDMSFAGAINSTQTLSNIGNEIKSQGCKIILQGKIYVTKFWVFRSTFKLTKEYLFKPESFERNDSGNKLSYILNKSLRGEEVLFSNIEPEQLNIFDFSILSDRKFNTGVVTPNMYFQNLKALSFDLPNLEVIYKGTKFNETFGNIRRIILNNVKMIYGKLLPFKILADDFPNCHKLSLEHLYLKLWEANEDIRLLNVSIFNFSIFDDNVCLKHKNREAIDLREVNRIDIKEISVKNINFTLSFLKTSLPVFFNHVGIIKNRGVLKIMSLDEQPFLLFNINYTFQSANNLKNRQIEIELSDINWQTTLKGLNNGEEVQIVDSNGQNISLFSLKTFLPREEEIGNQYNKKGNKYFVSSCIQNITDKSFDVSCVFNALIKNEEIIKKGIQINFLTNTEFKLTNDQFNVTCLLEKQSLVKQTGEKSFDKYLKSKISIFPKTNFLGFAQLDNLFLFKLENDEFINLQALSPKILDSKTVIGMFNYLSLDYSGGTIGVNIKESICVEEPQKLSETFSSVNWSVYFPPDYEIYISSEILPFGFKIKSPNSIHICFTANKILFKTFKLPINFEKSAVKYEYDALKDTLLIFLNTHLYEKKFNEFSQSNKVTLYEDQIDILINQSNQDILGIKERQDLLNELLFVLKKYNKLEEEIEYKMKPKINFKFWEKEKNSVFEITAKIESSSNIDSLLKGIEKSIFHLNSHKYFSKSFSENLQEKVFKKFMKHFKLLNDSLFKEIRLNIKSIEVNSKDGGHILKIYIPDYTFDRFEIEKFEISIEVYLKGISMFLKDNFLFEILIEDSENKKSKFINYEASKGLFNDLLELIKEKNSTLSSDEPKTDDTVNSNTENTDKILFVSKAVESHLHHIKNLPFFNLLHNECEIYVELFYENIFKFTLFEQIERQKSIEMEIINHNLDLLIGRLLSEFVFYYEYTNLNKEGSNIFESICYKIKKLLLNTWFWDIAKQISNIKTIQEKYEVQQKIKIKHSSNKFKTEIIYGTPLNETKKYFSIVYKNIVLSFYMGFQKNILENINITFEVSTEPLEDSRFNENTYIFKKVLSLYEKLYNKFKEDENYNKNNGEITVSIGQLSECYDSMGKESFEFLINKLQSAAVSTVNYIISSVFRIFRS